ncbi:MAG TPA: HAMP domain-containing sensor histidine kinase [Gemmatimonadales bacterium]|nr:HAMP domain-containing sensor histidine kinase [Gemmatimonadales bacterium]
MTFRSRILAGFGGVVLVPLVLFGLRVRVVMANRLTAEYERRVAAQADVIRADIARDGAVIARRLEALSEAIPADDRFRSAVLAGGDRPYVLDYAGTAMRSAGLAMLVIQDSVGRVVSSGHFRNAYDRPEPALPRALAAAEGGLALVEARTPEAPLLAIARVDSLRIAGRRYTVVGGLAIDSARLVALTPDPELGVTVALPTDTLTAGGADTAAAAVREVSLPFIQEGDSLGATRQARILVRHSLASLAALRHDVDVTFLEAVLAASAIALVLAGWLSLRISRPLSALARQTAAIDWDRLDVAFESERPDEIGRLTRLLGSMIERLRAGARRLREAERRLAMGDLARQVNHDVKNGLTPIRNVVRHLAQVAAGEPERLATVFRERERTLDSSIAYLEGLAGTYARLYPASVAGVCDTAEVIRESVWRLDRRGAELRTELVEPLPRSATDPLVLRRILENLVGNALDALDGGPGTITVAAAPGPSTNGRATVRITVSDTGKGMTRAELDRAFEGFYSTKPGGTGLGLAIVRRLVLDANGALRVETEPGAGSRFIVELPGVTG